MYKEWDQILVGYKQCLHQNKNIVLKNKSGSKREETERERVEGSEGESERNSVVCVSALVIKGHLVVLL